MAEIENLKIGNGGTLHIVGNEDIVANSWEAGKTYVKNKSYVIQEHRLYVCNVTHTSVEPFDATKWTEITIGDAIGNNIGDLSTLTTTDKSSLVGAVNEVNGAKTNVFKGKITIGTVSAGTKYDLFTLTNFTGGLVPDFATMKGLMYLGGGGNSNSYGYLFCNPITNLISYIPQVSDTNISIYIAVLY